VIEIMNMRPVLAILLLLLLSASARAQKHTTYAEPAKYPENAMMLNLGGIAVDYLNISYYRSFGAHHALGAYIGYLYHPVGDERITGYGYGLSYRFYPAGKSLARFYYSPTIGLQQGEVVKQNRAPALGVLLSGIVGWQWFPQDKFAVGLGIGGRVILGGRDEDPVLRDAFGGSAIITLDLGYGW
jgi:hypothetical protein